jgi:AcrR family transcriptional regulator
MRTLDEEKRERIGNAAIRLINTIGFADVSMSKIAKKAGVATSTIYLYFDNKQDMLNKLYLMVRSDFSYALRKGYVSSFPVEDSMRGIYFRIIKYFEENPHHSSFMEQFASSALIHGINREEEAEYFYFLVQLIDRGIQGGLLKNTSTSTIGSFLFYPIVHRIHQHQVEGLKMSRIEKERIFMMMWDAIKN